MELLKRLSEASGIPGREEEIREVIKAELESIVDEIRIDKLGNIICLKRGKPDNAKKVLIGAHMDEIGFLVNHINDKGFLKITPAGGLDPRTLIAQRVFVHGKEKLRGVIGIKPIHILTEEEKKKAPEIKELFIDLGMEKDEVLKYVRIGDPVSLDRELCEIGNCFTGKAFDDRIGVYVMIKTLKNLKDHNVDIYAVATVQEEVGLRGASVSGFDIRPDVAIALDVTLACDVPGIKGDEYISELGKGVALKIMDSASISNPKLVEFFRKLAKRNGIKHQLEILPRGGTDAGAFQRSGTGVPVITLSIPTRYVHSVVETVHKEDVKNCIDLLTSFLEVAHKANFEYI